MARNLRSGLRQSLKPTITGGFAANDLFTTAALDLNFAKYKNVGNLVDFTRASSGTYVGSDGLIKTATTNLLLYSTNFDNSYWLETYITTNTVTGPDGTTTAATYEGTGAGASSVYNATSATVSASTQYTYSIYIKLGTMSASNYKFAVYDVSNASFVGVDLVPAVTPTTTNWTRVSYTFTTPVGCTQIRVYPFRNSAPIILSTVHFWGAQLEQSSTVGEYVKTTSTINSAPRFDHDPTTGESLGLLVEESRINRFEWSNSAVDGETWNNVGVGLNLQTGATDPAGGTNGIIASDADNLSAGTYLQRTGIDSTLPANTVVTYSVWVKPISTPNDVVILNLFANGVTDSLAAVFTNTDGVLTYSSSSESGTAVFSDASAISYPNGWYRLVLTGIPSTTVGSDMRARINLGNYQRVQDTPRFYWYGAQLETGLASSPAASFVTSYIPTIGSTVTRAADVASISGTNFSSWYRQDEGTLFASAFNRQTYDGTNKFPYILQLDDGGNTERISFDHSVLSAGYRAQYVVRDNDVNTASITAKTGIATGLVSMSAAYGLNSFAASANGDPAVTDDSGTLPTVNRMQIGLGFGAQYNGTIGRLVYWGQRLPNETLQGITQQ